MSRRRTKKIVHKTEFLREEFFETKEIHDAAKLAVLSQIKTIQSELNVYDADLDAGFDNTKSKEKIEAPGARSPEYSPEEGEIDTESACILKHPLWVKKLYRKISVKVHPDKLLTEEFDEKERKGKLYNEATLAYAEGDYAGLIMIAIDLKLAIPDIDAIIDILNKKCIQYVKDTQHLKSTLFWSWHCSNSQQKQEILREFVKVKGWTVPGAAMKKSRPSHHPGKSVAWFRKKLTESSEDV
jgi:hypothetical protein